MLHLFIMYVTVVFFFLFESRTYGVFYFNRFLNCNSAYSRPTLLGVKYLRKNGIDMYKHLFLGRTQLFKHDGVRS